MKKEVEDLLKERLSVDHLVQSEEVSSLNSKTLSLIRSRKKAELPEFNIRNIACLFFKNYKVVVSAFAMVVVLLLISNTEIVQRDDIALQKDINAIDSPSSAFSNTFIASLKQNTYTAVASVNNNTVVSCISTFIGKN